MRYYILPDKGDYRILKVQPEDDASFHQRHRHEILFAGDCIVEVLTLFAAYAEENSLPERDTGNAGGQPASDTANSGDE